MRSDSPAFGFPAVFAPCSPNRIVFTLSPCLATTTCDFFGWFGVRFGLLNPDTPARFKRGSAAKSRALLLGRGLLLGGLLRGSLALLGVRVFITVDHWHNYILSVVCITAILA